MTPAVMDAPRLAATDTYVEAHRRLLGDAQRADRSHRPALARQIRNYASIVARAALAEEMDPQPHGLPEDRDYSGDRG